MSLAIPIHAITGILLDDGWHKVDTESVDIDSFEIVKYHDVTHFIAQLQAGHDPLISALGIGWSENEVGFYAPLNSVRAVRTK